jgi:hypothetical protein
MSAPDPEPFVLTPLVGRGGLSTFIAFFVRDEVVICDTGQQGFRTSVRVVRGIPTVEEWCAEKRAASKHVVALRYAEIQGVEMRLRMLRHLLVIHHEAIEQGGADYRTVERGPLSTMEFGLLHRPAADATIPKLQARFGARFQLSATGIYAWTKRHAPGFAQ